MKQTSNCIYSKENRILSECLKVMRKRSRMTQKELAIQLGYSQAYVSKYERGQMQLGFVDVRKICRVLGTQLEEFVVQYETNLKGGKKE